jgi:hypothetical protein
VIPILGRLAGVSEQFALLDTLSQPIPRIPLVANRGGPGGTA